MTDAPKCNGCGQPISFKQRADGGWTRFNLDDTPHTHERKTGGGGRPGRSEAELHDIRREAVLNAAVAYMAAKLTATPYEKTAEINAAHVLKVADAFLAWVEKDRPSQ